MTQVPPLERSSKEALGAECIDVHPGDREQQQQQQQQQHQHYSI
jgi:hypothetical protein